MFEIKEAPGGGFNFGITNHKLDALEEIPLYTFLTKKIVIERAFTYREESGYGIYQGEDEKGDRIKVSGIFPTALLLGNTYEMKGKVVDFRGEKQLSVEIAKVTRPVTKNGIVAYLKNFDGLYKNVEYLYELYGEEVLDLVAKDPNKIANEVNEIEKKSVLSWQDTIQKSEESQDSLNQLLEFGLNLRQAKKLFERYKEGVLEKIKQNPFLLTDEFPTFAFEKADKIARDFGYDPQGMYRIQEAIRHILKEATSQGHCYLPTEEMLERAKEVLTVRLTEEEMVTLLKDYRGKDTIYYQIGGFVFPIRYKQLSQQFKQYRYETNRFEKEKKRFVVIRTNRSDIQKELDNLATQNKVIVDDDKVYLPDIYEAERKVASRVIALTHNSTKEFTNAEEDLNQLLKSEGISLEEKQREAVIEFTRGKGGFFILNGSAGCGKTFSLNLILRVLAMQYEKLNRRLDVKVFAPTGKASKVAGKATGIACMTIHRGLKFKPDAGFEHNESNPLDADCIVVDESSMVDILLAKNLLSAIPDETKVIFLGDTKQLPSVGAGNVLLDLIESHVLRIVTLNVVKRQGKDSGIIRNANRMIAGEMISTCHDTQDAFVLRKESMLDAQLALIKSIREVQKVKHYGIEDIQVLCPQKSSLVGTYAMNYLIQQEFNPDNEDTKVLNKKIAVFNHRTKKEELVNLFFKRGDKVIHIRNNYDMLWYIKDKFAIYHQDYEMTGITNGETGVIEDIVKGKKSDPYKTRIIVRYEDGYVFYDDHFAELDHAFALTIHKSQGSQWRAVIIPIMKENYHMLDNNLFYTGYTRAQNFSVVVGQAASILHAIRTQKTRKRYTSLKERLVEMTS
ncbi:AAA family ATPase (plasmid) [Aneurinibacillus sp. Ricciae_BoGa-3]|uniref:AAA family ATPase n=1 Tax=Aneurinibacillus sp. Ricciae_BoGa-3 TaxID=3022697 RepID=UPI002341F816|nr:AAA family ATPase [Aneurinibacillus sp. Ricciae_BoGa-3]WCK57561.1 AAA family ATPase [Aneurinibacillus sp. Ricciae_BoGa-3]